MTVSRKSVRQGQYPQIEAAIETFIEKSHELGHVLQRQVIQEKAREVAQVLGVEGFKASSGWLSSLEKRSSLVSRRGNTTSVPSDDDAALAVDHHPAEQQQPYFNGDHQHLHQQQEQQQLQLLHPQQQQHQPHQQHPPQRQQQQEEETSKKPPTLREACLALSTLISFNEVESFVPQDTLYKVQNALLMHVAAPKRLPNGYFDGYFAQQQQQQQQLPQ